MTEDNKNQDKDISDKIGITTQEMEFYDAHNPLKLYARLINIGIKGTDALKITEWYETKFYNPLNQLIEYKKTMYEKEDAS